MHLAPISEHNRAPAQSCYNCTMNSPTKIIGGVMLLGIAPMAVKPAGAADLLQPVPQQGPTFSFAVNSSAATFAATVYVGAPSDLRIRIEQDLRRYQPGLPQPIITTAGQLIYSS